MPPTALVEDNEALNRLFKIAAMPVSLEEMLGNSLDTLSAREGDPLGWSVQDITARKLVQEEIQRLAMTDHLTGLANRNRFHRRFAESLLLVKRENFNLALLLLDLDEFKPVKDNYGHQMGDEVLKAVRDTSPGAQTNRCGGSFGGR